MGCELEAQEDRLKAEVRELFKLVKPESQNYVIGALQKLHTNEQRRNYLRGWLKPELSGGAFHP